MPGNDVKTYVLDVPVTWAVLDGFRAEMIHRINAVRAGAKADHHRLGYMIAELDSKLDGVRAELSADIDAENAELMAEIHEVGAGLHEVKAEMARGGLALVPDVLLLSPNLELYPASTDTYDPSARLARCEALGAEAEAQTQLVRDSIEAATKRQRDESRGTPATPRPAG